MTIKPKLFHHDNLKLDIIHSADFDIYTIIITRLNTNETFDLFGIFQTLDSALQKFNSISL